jgi:Flp pilus assembly pilin Flp
MVAIIIGITALGTQVLRRFERSSSRVRAK